MTLGNFATKFVLQTRRRASPGFAGQVHEWHGRTVIPTFHPAAILHGGGEKSRQFQMLREDFRLVRRTLDAPTHPADAPTHPADVPPGLIAVPEAEPVGAAPDPDQLELF